MSFPYMRVGAPERTSPASSGPYATSSDPSPAQDRDRDAAQRIFVETEWASPAAGSLIPAAVSPAITQATSVINPTHSTVD